MIVNCWIILFLTLQTLITYQHTMQSVYFISERNWNKMARISNGKQTESENIIVMHLYS